MDVMPLSGSPDINRALALVGELLAAEGKSYAVVIVGGAALNLLGVVRRTTNDVDIIAFGEKRPDDTWTVVQAPTPLPAPLVAAIRTVARDLRLAGDWMNGGPAPQSAFGFPPGMHDRIAWRDYGALRVGIVDRAALICLKLHAAVDNAMHGRHVRDLLALNPADAELHAASEWVKTQDAGSQFSSQVDQAVAYVRAQRESSQR